MHRKHFIVGFVCGVAATLAVAGVAVACMPLSGGQSPQSPNTTDTPTDAQEPTETPTAAENETNTRGPYYGRPTPAIPRDDVDCTKPENNIKCGADVAPVPTTPSKTPNQTDG